MKLSVVILNYNVRYFLELCLQSVQAALTDIPSEIIVVDNNSVDDSCAMVKKEFPEVILIENNNNIGFSKANNQAVKLAKGQYICILNPDTVVAEDTFAKILEFIANKPNLGITGCKLVDGAGCFLPESKRNIPTKKIALQKLLGYSKPYYASSLPENSSGKVEVLTGAFMMMERSFFEELKGFDESFFMYGEDIDLCYRARMLGRNNYYLSNTSIIHFKGESTQKDKSYFKRFYGAMQLFHDKHFRSNKILRFLIFSATKLLAYTSPKLCRSNHNRLASKRVLFLKPHSKGHWAKDKEIDDLNTVLEAQKKEQIDLIFDTNNHTYKSIITNIQKYKSKTLSFKICPKKTSYCVGSDTSNRRGELIHFDQFEQRTYF